MALLSSETNMVLLPALGWSLVHLLWQAGLLALALALGLKISRKNAPRRNYAICWVTLAGMILCPILTYACLRFEIGAPLASELDALSDAGAFASLQAPGHSEPQPILTWLIPAADRDMRPIALLWLVGVLLFLGRVLLGFRWVKRLQQSSSRPVPEGLHETILRLASRLGVKPPIRLFASSAVATPIVVGWVRPVILLPSTLLADLTQEHLEAVLAHELAHIRRWDCMANTIQAVIEALFFFHPAVWWVSQQIRREREHCCDDLAVQVSGSALIYAKALATLEEHRAPAKPQLSLGASGGNLAVRITRLFKQGHAATPATGTTVALAALGAFTLAALGILSVTATERVRAQSVEPSSQTHALPAGTAKTNTRPNMSCTFYDVNTHGHRGVCEVPSRAAGPFYCRQAESPQPQQLQVGCERKVQRLRDWEREQARPRTIATARRTGAGAQASSCVCAPAG